MFDHEEWDSHVFLVFLVGVILRIGVGEGVL